MSKFVDKQTNTKSQNVRAIAWVGEKDCNGLREIHSIAEYPRENLQLLKENVLFGLCGQSAEIWIESV